MIKDLPENVSEKECVSVIMAANVTKTKGIADFHRLTGEELLYTLSPRASQVIVPKFVSKNTVEKIQGM